MTITPFAQAKADALVAIDFAAVAPGNEDLAFEAGWRIGLLADLLLNDTLFEDIAPDDQELPRLKAMIEALTEADADPDL